MSRLHDDVVLAVQLRFGDRVLSQQYKFPLQILQNIRRPCPKNIVQPGSNPLDYWDFSIKTDLRKKLIDMIATDIAVSIGVAFEKEFE